MACTCLLSPCCPKCMRRAQLQAAASVLCVCIGMACGMQVLPLEPRWGSAAAVARQLIAPAAGGALGRWILQDCAPRRRGQGVIFIEWPLQFVEWSVLGLCLAEGMVYGLLWTVVQEGVLQGLLRSQLLQCLGCSLGRDQKRIHRSVDSGLLDDWQAAFTSGTSCAVRG